MPSEYVLEYAQELVEKSSGDMPQFKLVHHVLTEMSSCTLYAVWFMYYHSCLHELSLLTRMAAFDLACVRTKHELLHLQEWHTALKTLQRLKLCPMSLLLAHQTGRNCAM